MPRKEVESAENIRRQARTLIADSLIADGMKRTAKEKAEKKALLDTGKNRFERNIKMQQKAAEAFAKKAKG